ncbi:MAG: N-6 DNA methylase [Longibaculum sp.]
MASSKLMNYIDKTRGYPNDFDSLSFALALEIINEIGKCDSNYNPLYELKTLSLVYGTSVSKVDLINQITLVLGEEIGQYLNLCLKTLDDVMISNLINAVNNNEERLIDSKEDYIELCNHLYSGYGTSQFDITTPKSLNTLMSKLLDLKSGESIYDCTSGVGTTILSAANETNTIYSQDINKQVMIKQELIYKLLKYSNVTLSTDNSLLNPMLEEGGVDKAVCNSPFMFKMMEEPKELVSKIDDTVYSTNRESDIYFYNLVSKVARKKAVFVAPSGLSFKQNKIAVAFKEWLCKSNYLEAVIQLPTGLFSPYTNVSTVLFVINKEKKDSNIMMIDISDSKFIIKEKRTVVINPDNMDELVKMINSKLEILSVSKLITIDDLTGEWNLTPSRFIEVEVDEESTVDIQSLMNERSKLLNEFKKQNNLVNDYIKKLKGVS